MSWLLEQLRRRKDDRGMMANLRCALVDNKRHRAWPALSRLGVKIEDDVQSFIAGLFAMHPEETTTGNFGDTCRLTQLKRGDTKDDKLTPTERRFQSLLVAEKGQELHGRVLRLVMLAHSNGVSVNYEQLEKDLRYWGERTKTAWASAFWTPKTDAFCDEEAS